MKKIKILALALAAVLMMGILAGCSTSASDINVNLVFKTEAGEFFNQDITVNAKDATVETVVAECTMIYDFVVCSFDSRGSLSVKYTTQDADYPDTTDYYWEFTLNGEEATAKPGNTPVKDGDKIVYSYIKFIPEETKAAN